MRFIEITDEGVLQLEGLDSLLTERTKLVAMTHVSNVLRHHQSRSGTHSRRSRRRCESVD